MTVLDWTGVGVVIAVIIPLLTWLFSTMGTLGRIDERTATLVKQTTSQSESSAACRKDVWGKLDEHGHRLTVVEETIKARP